MTLTRSCEQTFPATLVYLASHPADRALPEQCLGGAQTVCPPPPLPLRRGSPRLVFPSRCPPHYILPPPHPRLHYSLPP